MTEENKEFIDAYIFMTYENMLKTLEKGRLKLLDPEKCNDPFEFMPASPTISEDGATSFDSNYLRKENGLLCFTKTYKSPPCGHTMLITIKDVACISDSLLSRNKIVVKETWGFQNILPTYIGNCL